MEKTLSPEQKVAKMNHNKAKEDDNNEVEEKKKELENLQDLLLQTGKEKEEINMRLSKSNEKSLYLEKTNEALTKEINYLKVEGQKSAKNLHDLDKEYTIQLKDLKSREIQKDHEILFLKTENEKCTRDLNKIDSAYKIQVIELKKSIDQQDIEIKIKNDQLRKNGIMQAQEDRAADLQTSLEALVVTEAETSPATSFEVSPETRPEASPETRSKASPETRPDASPETRSEASILPAPQDTHETNPEEAQDTLQAAPGDNLQQPGHPLIQVDECVENFRCEGNC